MNESDQVCLIERAQRGDAWAFDALVRRFQNRSVAYARCLLHDVESAEDAAQESFLQAWRDLPALHEPATFASWLRLIVFKHCDRIQREKRVAFVSLDLALMVSGGMDSAWLAEQGAVADEVRAVFDSLPERGHEIALLYYLGERDIAETAEFLGLPRTTVKNRLHAALVSGLETYFFVTLTQFADVRDDLEFLAAARGVG